MKDKVISFLNRNESAIQSIILGLAVGYCICAYGEVMYNLGEMHALAESAQEAAKAAAK